MAIQKRGSTQVQPPDATTVSLVLQALGVQQYDPKVVQQILEYAHRYTTDVLQDALVYMEHANKTDIELDDVQLAIQGRINHSFTTPPPKEFLLELAEEKNKIPLPLLPEKYGNRLPAEKYCLTGLNFSISPNTPPPPPPPPSSLPNATSSQLTSLSTTTMDAPETDQQQSVQQQKRRRDDMEDDDYDF